MKNYNYAILFYDVSEKRTNKVFKICKKYLYHYQRSVFKGAITPSNIKKMQKELYSIITEDDFVSIILLMNQNSFEEIIIGSKMKKADELLI